jgi:hypothetical protein
MSSNNENRLIKSQMEDYIKIIISISTIHNFMMVY